MKYKEDIRDCPEKQAWEKYQNEEWQRMIVELNGQLDNREAMMTKLKQELAGKKLGLEQELFEKITIIEGLWSEIETMKAGRSSSDATRQSVKESLLSKELEVAKRRLQYAVNENEKLKELNETYRLKIQRLTDEQSATTRLNKEESMNIEKLVKKCESYKKQIEAQDSCGAAQINALIEEVKTEKLISTKTREEAIQRDRLHREKIEALQSKNDSLERVVEHFKERVEDLTLLQQENPSKYNLFEGDLPNHLMHTDSSDSMNTILLKSLVNPAENGRYSQPGLLQLHNNPDLELESMPGWVRSNDADTSFEYCPPLTLKPLNH